MNSSLGRNWLCQPPAAVPQLGPLCTTPASSHWSPGHLWPSTKQFCPPAAEGFAHPEQQRSDRSLIWAASSSSAGGCCYRYKVVFSQSSYSTLLENTWFVGRDVISEVLWHRLCMIYECKSIPERCSGTTSEQQRDVCADLGHNLDASDETGGPMGWGRSWILIVSSHSCLNVPNGGGVYYLSDCLSSTDFLFC